LIIQQKLCEEHYFHKLMQIVKGTSINFFGSIASHVLGFLYVFLLTKFLNTRDLGLYYLGFTIISFMGIISVAGTEAGILRFVSIYHGCKDPNRMRGTLSGAFIFVIPLSLVLALVLFFFSGIISNNIFSKPDMVSVLKVFSIYLPFYSLTLICLAATQAMKYMQYRVYSLDIANTILKIAFMFVFFYFGLQLFSAVFATVVSIILVTGLSVYFLKRVFPQNVKGEKSAIELKKLLSFSIPQSFSTIINNIVGMTDTLILGYFTMAASIGIYNVALKIAVLGSSILGSFNIMFSPIIADMYQHGKHDELKNLYKTITKWVLTLSFPIFLFFIFFSEAILKIFGSDFVIGSACLIILCIGQVINAMTGPSGLMVLMSGHPYVTLFNSVFTFSMNIALNLMLIPQYGIIGAAVATSVSMGIINFLRLIEVYYFMRIFPYDLSYLKSLFAGLGCILLVSYGAKIIFPIDGFWSLVMVFSIFLLTYSVCLILLKLDDADRFVLSKIRQRLIIAR
jgi:O-antigen/teichoic acid export membrane protein